MTESVSVQQHPVPELEATGTNWNTGGLTYTLGTLYCAGDGAPAQVAQ